MKKLFYFVFVLFITQTILSQSISSPSGNFILKFVMTPDGQPSYDLSYKGKPVIEKSLLGIDVKNQADFVNGLTVTRTDTSSFNEVWTPVWGEESKIRNNYKELAVTLQKEKRTMIIRFRVFNDGLGFRYEFPPQNELKYFIVSDELTEFNLTGDHKTFWIPGDYDSQEYVYSTSQLSKVDAGIGKSVDEIGSKSFISRNAVQTPLMMKTGDGLYINIHEAALFNYPVMQIEIDKNTFTLKSHIVPDCLGNKAYMQTPHITPWRTIIVGEKATDILASRIILNLNEPSKIEDVSWIKPVKYVGIWWEMHIDYGTWNYADVNNVKLDQTDWKSLKPNGKHSANTERTKRYIDFAAEHGFDGVLVEGWNIGWEDWAGNWKEEVFDFVTPYPDFNVQEIHKYAESKGVEMIMHHETSSSVTNYERRQDEAYKFMKDNGYDAVKTGYVGYIIPRGEHHDGQWMVNHYNRTAEKTAKYKIMIDTHESIRPTGQHRTYPNWLASEAARGNEFNAWSEGNPPEHETILPFTRLMGGPMDYTPGIFQIKLDYWNTGKTNRVVHTTLTKQLALYLTMYSPLQMAADLPEAYERFMDAFQFIKDVAVDWDESRYLEAEPGDYLTIARKTKGKDEWFIGAITDENARQSQVKLDFLTAGKSYVATVYADAKDADWDKNPMAYQINSYIVNSKTSLKFNLAKGGGTAVSLKLASDEEVKKLKKY